MFNSSSATKSAAVTAMVMIMPPLLLQKPSRNSKAKDHKVYLEKRLTLWKEGKIQELIRECRVIQRKLTQGKKKTENVEKVFVRLMLQGKVSAALRWIGSQRSGRMEITEEVLDVLRKKHPGAAPVVEGAVIQGPIETIPKVLYDYIDGAMIHFT